MKKHNTGQSIYLTAGSHIVKIKVNIPEKPIGVVIMCDDQVQPEMVSRNELISQIFNKECFITLQVLRDHSSACDGNVVLPAIIHWLEKDTRYSQLPLTVFCSGISAGSVLSASINLDKNITAIVIRSGCIELTPAELGKIKVPVLFIVADRDEETANHIKGILPYLNDSNNLKVIANATRHFTELGKLGHVVFLAVEWFRKNMFANAKTA